MTALGVSRFWKRLAPACATNSGQPVGPADSKCWNSFFRENERPPLMPKSQRGLGSPKARSNRIFRACDGGTENCCEKSSSRPSAARPIWRTNCVICLRRWVNAVLFQGRQCEDLFQKAV